MPIYYARNAAHLEYKYLCLQNRPEFGSFPELKRSRISARETYQDFAKGNLGK